MHRALAGMHRALAGMRWALVGVAVVGFAASTVVVRWQQRAKLSTEQELPAEVRSEVGQTWDRFLDVFGSRRRCFDDVSLLLVDEIDDGDARYLIGERRIEIEIPTSPRRFRESLVHELAHHVEHTCGEFAILQVDYLRLPGVDGTWAGSGPWETTPSELWAETVVLVVNGERVRHGRDMPLAPGAEDLVAHWARSG